MMSASGTGSNVPLKFRIVTMGQGAVGKSAILQKFFDEKFPEKYKETVDDLFSRNFYVNGILLEVDVLDTAGKLVAVKVFQLRHRTV